MFNKLLEFKDHTDDDNMDVKKAFARMDEQIREKGGTLHFSMKVDDEGWFSVCKEFPNITTGGSNTNPAQEEIFMATIEAVKTAFDVPITKVTKTGEKFESTINPTNVKVSWERDLHLV